MKCYGILLPPFQCKNCIKYSLHSNESLISLVSLLLFQFSVSLDALLVVCFLIAKINCICKMLSAKNSGFALFSRFLI